MIRGDFWLDPINGAIVEDELRRIEQRMYADDWKDARARVGENATAFDLARTSAQRRADALVEMATRSGTAPQGGRRPEPLFTVLVGYETFAGAMCELNNGTVVSPSSLLPWVDQAWIERAVFDGPSRIIDLGAHKRLFKDATRRAVQIRDRQCFDPSCDTPSEQCQIDHIQPWAAGGTTTQDNGRPACDYHNRHRNGEDGRGRPPPNGP